MWLTCVNKYRQAIRTTAVFREAKTWVWEEIGKAMEKDFWLTSKKFCQTIRQGKHGLVQAVVSRDEDLLTLPADVV